MTYNFCKNGCEDGFKRYKFAQLGKMKGGASAAIDELGRLFTWGQNFEGYCGLGSGGGPPYNALSYIERITQVGNANNWIKVSGGELSTMALNNKGEIWGFGDLSTDITIPKTRPGCSALGLPDGSAYGVSGDEGWYPIKGSTDQFWSDMAHDYYHTLLLNEDKYLYTVGMNLYYGLGAGLTYAENYSTPVLNPTLSGIPIKIIDCDELANLAVTEDNRVYVWGDFWNYSNFNYQIPTQLTGLPAGSVIVDAATGPSGIILCLSDGTLWAAGEAFLWGDNYVHGDSDTFEQVTGLSSKTITKVWQGGVGGEVAFVLDSNGTIWGIDDAWSIYHGRSSAPASEYVWDYIGVEYEGERKYIDIVANTYQGAYYAIDDRGYLWTWGSQNWGPHLAIDSVGNQTQADYDPNITDIVAYRQTAGLALEAVRIDGDPTYLNVLPVGESPYLQPDAQDRFHRPCGHWHERLFTGLAFGGYAVNCWMPSVAVDGTKVFFVAAGKHMQLYSETGCEIYFFEYDIGSNQWTLLYTDTNINAANAPGGAAYDGSVYMFANYKADAHGTRFAPEYFDNFAIGVWVYNGTTMQYNEFAAPEQYLQGKVGCTSGGMAAFAYEDGAGDLIVKVSTDYGATWNTRKTVGALAARNDFSLCVDPNGYIYLAHQITSSAVMIERSINNGTSWTTQLASLTTLASMTQLKINADNSMLFIFARDGGNSNAIAKYSSNAGATWSNITSVPYATVVAAGTNVVDGENNYAVCVARNSLFNKLYDSDADAYFWTQKDLSEYSYGFAQNQTDMNCQNGVFAASSFGFYTTPKPFIALAVSIDRGENWSVRQTPLGFAGTSAEELTEFDGNPRDWAERFVRQVDVFEHWEGF